MAFVANKNWRSEMNTLAWTFYWIGVVISPIVIGMMLPNKKDFKVFDDGIPIFILSFMWPFVVALAVVLMSVLGVAALVGFLWISLITLGSSFVRKLETKERGVK